MLRIVNVVAAMIVAASASIIGAQSVTSIIKPISFGISGGVAIPTADLSSGVSGSFSGVNTGYNVTGSIALALPAMPFSLRADAAYTGFGTRNLAFTANAANGSYNADARVLGFTGNVVLPLPLPTVVLRPYLIGGGGIYNVRTSPTSGGSSSESNLGFNLGGGVRIPLTGFDTFIEARYHHVNQDRGTVAFVPITIGVMF